MKRILTIFAAITMAIAFTACGTPSEGEIQAREKFVGEWKFSEGETDPEILTINDDGTGTITFDSYDAVYELTYKISKDKDGHPMLEFTHPTKDKKVQCLLINDTVGHEIMVTAGYDGFSLGIFSFYARSDEYEDVMAEMQTNFASQLTAEAYPTYAGKLDDYYPFIVVHNPTEYPLKVDISINTYDSEHNLVESCSLESQVVVGNTDCLFSRYTNKPFETYEYTIDSATMSLKYFPLYDKLSYTSDPKHLIIQNNGQYESEYAKIYCLWLNDDQIVDCEALSCLNLLPGESKSCDIKETDQEYTERLFFIYSEISSDIGMFTVE